MTEIIQQTQLTHEQNIVILSKSAGRMSDSTTTTTTTTTTTNTTTTTTTTTTTHTNDNDNHQHTNNNNGTGLRDPPSVLRIIKLARSLRSSFRFDPTPPLWRFKPSLLFQRFKIHQKGVQWKQGVVIYMMLYTSSLYNTTAIHCTLLPLHPPVMNTHEYPAAPSPELPRARCTKRESAIMFPRAGDWHVALSLLFILLLLLMLLLLLLLLLLLPNDEYPTVFRQPTYDNQTKR